jgi:hypothetical protein
MPPQLMTRLRFSLSARYPTGSAAASCRSSIPQQSLTIQPTKHVLQKKKMTLGWVVNGERRHAGRQGELVPRGHSCIIPTKKHETIRDTITGRITDLRHSLWPLPRRRRCRSRRRSCHRGQLLFSTVLFCTLLFCTLSHSTVTSMSHLRHSLHGLCHAHDGVGIAADRVQVRHQHCAVPDRLRYACETKLIIVPLTYHQPGCRFLPIRLSTLTIHIPNSTVSLKTTRRYTYSISILIHTTPLNANLRTARQSS